MIIQFLLQIILLNNQKDPRKDPKFHVDESRDKHKKLVKVQKTAKRSQSHEDWRKSEEKLNAMTDYLACSCPKKATKEFECGIL